MYASRGSPLSVEVSLRAIRRGKGMPLAACLQMENRVVTRMVCGPSDFQEGVRAMLIDRDNRPTWLHSTLEEVRHGRALSRVDVHQRSIKRSAYVARSVLRISTYCHKWNVLYAVGEHRSLCVTQEDAARSAHCASLSQTCEGALSHVSRAATMAH